MGAGRVIREDSDRYIKTKIWGKQKVVKEDREDTLKDKKGE